MTFRASHLAAFSALLLAFPILAPAAHAPVAFAGGSGCEAPTPDPMPEGAGHSHSNPAQHAFGTPNLHLRGRIDPSRDGLGPIDAETAAKAALTEPIARLLGGARFGEVDVLGTYAYVAMISSPTAVLVIDVSDPTNPREVSRWAPASGGYVTDVKALGKGEAFVASTQYGSKQGLWYVDSRDKADPKLIAYYSVGSGVHMIATHTIQGFEFVFGATASSGAIPVYVRLTDPLGLGLVNELRKVQSIPTGSGAHDSWAWTDPIDGRNVLFVANGGGGFRAYDVGFPLLDAPEEISRWDYQGFGSFYHHTVRAQIVDGKRYVYAAAEGGVSGSGVSKFAVLDVTDFAKPVLVGGWGNPGNHRSNGFMFSLHNFQLVEGRLYLAHYHGGVWVFDASTPARAANPHPVGYYLPNLHPSGSLIPDVWDVVVEEGRMFLADIGGGLYVVRYECDEEGSGGPTSIG